MIAQLKALLPNSAKATLRRWQRIVRNYGSARSCNVCGHALGMFTTHGVPPEPDFLCPVCYSKPPHRLAQHWFASHWHLFRPGVIVHIAPEPELSRRLERTALRASMLYRKGSIQGSGEQYLNLLSLPFDDASVDLLYCCHVLNSMQDDRGAMREVRRVLKPTGTALLQVPAFYQGATTLETNSDAERSAVFNDVGIARCYTEADYGRRLVEAGFDFVVYRATDLPHKLVEAHALHREILHVCRRAP